MRRLLTYLAPYKGRMAFGLTIKTIGTLMDLVIPYILAHIIDNVIETGNTPAVIFWGLVMIISSLIAVIFNVCANRMASRVAANCIRAIRHDLFEKTLLLSSRQVDSYTVASLESRLTSDTYNVHHMVGMLQRMGVRAPLLLIGGILVTLTLDPVLTLVLLCTLPFIFFFTYYISIKGLPLFKKSQECVDGFTKVVREDASGIRVIKALSKTEFEKDRFDKANINASKAEKKAGLTTSLINPIMTLLLNTGLALVILVGAHRVYDGNTGAGTIIAFMSYFTIISNALLSVSRMFIMSSKGIASMGRIDEVLSETPELFNGGDESVAPEGKKGSHYIEFRDVSFSYGKTNALEDISFALEKGQTLGIIGATGSGKTSLINLLMRFYDVKEGEIILDGKNVKDHPTKKLRQKFGIVFQNDFLFADKISENVKFGRDISDDEVEKALSLAQASEFVSSYDDKSDHELEIKGANLSGGQKQRLLIARALADSPEILILDDSSSALDYKTDSLLRKALANNLTDSTVIIVAQRISSIMHADLILVLDEGRIIGKGTHEELISSCPIYSQISESQMGGMLVE